jgi:hypothetical protein
MTTPNGRQHTIGWIGAGRMGYQIAERLLAGSCDLAIWNRTRSKAEPLAAMGATIVDSPAELADRDIVFTMVAGSDDFKQVVTGASGVLSRGDVAPASSWTLDHLPRPPPRCGQRRSAMARRWWRRRSAGTRRWSGPAS